MTREVSARSLKKESTKVEAAQAVGGSLDVDGHQPG